MFTVDVFASGNTPFGKCVHILTKKIGYPYCAHMYRSRVVSLSQKQHLFLLYISIVYASQIACCTRIHSHSCHKHTHTYTQPYTYPWNQLPSFYVPRTGTKIQHSILGVENVRTNICVISVFSVISVCLFGPNVLFIFYQHKIKKKSNHFIGNATEKSAKFIRNLCFVSATK